MLNTFDQIKISPFQPNVDRIKKILYLWSLILLQAYYIGYRFIYSVPIVIVHNCYWGYIVTIKWDMRWLVIHLKW